MTQNENARKLVLLRLLITIFGLFFGGWWTSFLLDIFNSLDVHLLNKCMAIGNILTIFFSFYIVVYLKSWKKALGVFVLIDAMIAFSVFDFFFPNPLVETQSFILKGAMALVSLGLLQFLTIHYSKLYAATERTSSQ